MNKALRESWGVGRTHREGGVPQFREVIADDRRKVFSKEVIIIAAS